MEVTEDLKVEVMELINLDEKSFFQFFAGHSETFFSIIFYINSIFFIVFLFLFAQLLTVF